MTYYRVHSATESLDTILDVDRPDGWVASDETRETQPRGVSCCGSIEDLICYAREYSMAIRQGDVVVAIEGTICDDDRDNYALRVAATSYRVIGKASSLTSIGATLGHDAWRVDALLRQWS